MKAPFVKQALLLAFVFSVAAALCASTQNTPAGQSVPSGPVSFSFTNLTAPVYDLTGSYQFDQQALVAGGTPVNLSMGFSVQQDAAGRLRGSGVTNVQIGSDFYAATYSVSGTVTGGGSKATRATFSVRWAAQDATDGASAPLTISVQYKLEVSPWVLNGTAHGQAKFAKLGSRRINSPIAGVLLPAGVDGSWSVAMNLQASGGSGSITLPNGRSLQTSLASSYSANSGLDRIKLSGTGGDRGNTLSLNFFPSTRALQSLSGKILGQTVSFKSPSGTILGTLPQASAPSQYAGYQACLECHAPIQQTLNSTRHTQVGVHCEDCHGPAANHAANDYDPASRPLVDLAGTLCGGCHSGPQHPIYAEWKASGHATVVEDLNPTDRISSCGRCHSGSVRESLLDGVPLPVGGANVPLGCPTCHEPHQLTGNPVQLRNPVFSTNDYFLTTTEVFANKYDPNVNLCAQCHNHRGASWTVSSEPPHSSPQYNMLLGTIGELDSGLPHYEPAFHALFITNQCVGCHMQSTPYQSPAKPAITGHTFAMDSYGVCAGCHGSAANASNLVGFVSGFITNQMQAVQASLDQWAATKAPAALSAKYGTRAWEYTTPGRLSPGGSGPNAAEQTQIPVNIQKARFNLYLVLYDGSLGVHNPLYTLTLLDTAQDWVEQELSQ